MSLPTAPRRTAIAATTRMIRIPPPVGHALLDLVAGRPLLADVLAEPEVAQQPDERRHEDDHDDEDEQEALDQLDRPDPHGSRSSAQGGDEPVELDPAGGLDEDDVARPRAAAGARRGRPRASLDLRGSGSGSSPASRAPSAIPAAPVPDDDQQVGDPAGGPARPRRWPVVALLARARASRRGRRSAARAGRPARRAPRASRPARRCSCRRRSSRRRDG